MSTKTLRKRIAVVAVSALTAGVLSVASAPASNAAVETSMNLFQNTAAGAAYSLSTTSSTSQGLIGTIATGTNGTGMAQAVAMYSSGVIVVANANVNAAQKITITNGTLVSSSGCTDGSGTLTIEADLSGCSTTAHADTAMYAAIKPAGAGKTMVITGFENGLVTPTWRITVTVVCLLYTSPSPRDRQKSRMPSSA